MRLTFVFILMTIFLFGGMVLAQDEAPPIPEEMAQQLQEAVARAENAADEAGDARDLAFNLLGLFEALSFIVTVVAGIAAIFGFQRLLAAQGELNRARERIEQEISEARANFEAEIQSREEELKKLRLELESSATAQRTRTSQALLAQSLLPLGERQYRAQDYVGALNTYHRALELDPDNPIVHYRIGYVAVHSGDLELARQHFATAIEMVDDFAPAMAGLGFVYRRIGEKMELGIERDEVLNKAEGLMLQALKISPKLVDDDNESWWGILGGLYRRRGQTDQAIYAYTKATEVTPQSTYGYGNLAMLYMKNNDRERMLQTYERVEKLAAAEAQADVDNYWGYADLVTSRLAIGKSEAAFEVLPHTLSIAPPDSPYALNGLLETLQELKHMVEPHNAPPIEEAINQIQATIASLDTVQQEFHKEVE